MDGAVSEFSALERASGKLSVGVKHRDGVSVLESLYQQGCLKARFPKWHETAKSGYLINTTGGIAEGDRLQTEIDVAEGASAVLTTQAAERVYRARSLESPAFVDTQVRVGRQAKIFWIPQETILFDGAAVHRNFEFEVESGGTLVAAETLVLGRSAMGEVVKTANLFDRWRIRRDGELVFADGFRLSGDVRSSFAGPALLRESTAISTLLVVGSDTLALQQALRDRAATDHVVSGSSVRRGVLVVRAASPDPALLAADIQSKIQTIDAALHGGTEIATPILSRRQF